MCIFHVYKNSTVLNSEIAFHELCGSKMFQGKPVQVETRKCFEGQKDVKPAATQIFKQIFSVTHRNVFPQGFLGRGHVFSLEILCVSGFR